MRASSYYTRQVLIRVLPDYCRGTTADIGAGRAKYRELIGRFAECYLTVDNGSSEAQFGQREAKPDVMADVLDLPLADGSLDTAVCTEVLEHVVDPFRLMAELARVLKSGGYLIVSSPWAAPYHPEPDDYWRFSESALRLMCEKSGLKVVEVHKKGGFFTTLFFFFNRGIELNTPRLNRLRKSLGPLNRLAERLAGGLDRLIPTPDGVGFLIVAQKP